MAWEAPKTGQWRCERCDKHSETAEGWVHIEVTEAGEDPQTYDACAMCKLHVRKTLKALMPHTPKVAS